MKIAIVAPSPVPFTVGGAENLWWALLNYINQQTPHQADLIKLPSPERNFWELVESYRNFCRIDLSHFDLVISGKYPAWMVYHPNHVCYMLHRLRGLYDTYHFTGQPMHYVTQHSAILALQSFMVRNRGARKALPEFFEMLEHLREANRVPPNAFAFPGPLAREVVFFLDGIGLASNAMKKFSAISRTVANRKEYFPEGAAVEVIYPPSNLKSFRCSSGSYLFSASRLDGPKRVSLLVEAMKYVKGDMELKIAGTGPDAERLREMASGDKRIDFVGFVNDTEIIDLYANALAVLYAPYDEDYGLITIEAMMSGKPVITTMDSGGPNEFVRNGETGFSVQPEPRAIAERIDYLVEHKDEARQMGLAAQRAIQDITWENVANGLLIGNRRFSLNMREPKHKKITVALTYPVFPPRGGGQSRIFHLYSQLAKRFDIDLVTFADFGDRKGLDEYIAPGLREIRIPRSCEHETAESELIRETNCLQITDVAMPKLYLLTPGYVEALRESAADANAVVASHPYLLSAIKEVSDKPIWYEAHNVESELKKNILSGTPAGRKLLELTRRVEEECCKVSALILVCFHGDGLRLRDLYNADLEKIIEVPNGVDLESVTYVSLEQRLLAKKQLGLESSFSKLFMGSWHQPNLEAVESIFKIAMDLPEAHFLIIGSVGLASFEGKKVPANVRFMGIVDDETKDTVLGLADVAINPMRSGSGTNLKMLDYCAAGIPVISTPHGLRGLAFEDGVHLTVAHIDRFPDAVRCLRQMNGSELAARIERARDCVVKQYSWAIIARNLIREIEKRDIL